ncbi:MAG: Gfo/Idh/MocA family oxidoreductase [Fimbriimonadaceae bacterium]|nr:Gfo/Idh/MocA family oxidoreductase [Fimbriimonadaceae bacterium]
MLRLSLVSAATYGQTDRTPGSFHGTAFASAFNGYDDEYRKQFQWTFAASTERLPDCQVVKIQDPHREWAERLATACHIPQVVDTYEEAAEDVDAVIVVDDGSRKQYLCALPALRKGLPVFIDKPLAMTAAEVADVLAYADRYGAKVMSASSLRYVPDIQQVKAAAPSLQPIPIATTICGNELIYYGIHALEMAYEVLGPGAVSVLNVGRPGRNLCRVRFASGTDLMLMVGEGEYMRAGYQIALHGKGGWQTCAPDLNNLYVYLLERFVKMVQTGEQPVPNAEMHEVIAVLEAGKRSLLTGQEVEVAAVLAERGPGL